MKQKLALACTLVHEPELILLDEPTTGVDPVSRREFWKLLSEFLAQGITILMSTPYMDEAERCGRVALLHEGRVLAADTPDRLRQTIRGRMLEVVVARAADTMDVVRDLPGVLDAQVFGDRLHVTLQDEAGPEAIERFRRALQASGLAAAVRPVTPSLEDVFIAQLARKEQAA
jgi:ABC-2 type transport system ATP-binding protein